MQPLLTAAQIREADAFTIQHESISSVELMERAASEFTALFVQQYPDRSMAISIYCGTGNNGGDGLAIARLLKHLGYKPRVVITRFSEKSSDDFDVNQRRLAAEGGNYIEIKKADELPEEKADLIIDAMLGSGLNKPLSGDYERVVKHLNQLHKTVVAVDIPTGLPSEGKIEPGATILKVSWVITFQQPKLSFLLPESGRFIDRWDVVNIGLDETFINSLESPYQFTQQLDIKALLKPRKRFSNKGTYGHALIIAGQTETMGAALLSASACAQSGAGLTTACIPKSGLTALNTAHPEIMAVIRPDDSFPEISWEKFSAVAIGPGLGKDDRALALLEATLNKFDKPVVMDADALNMLSTHPELLKLIPEGSILTPHMKEFDRLFGEHKSWWERMQTAVKKAQELRLNIILKNDYTLIATPGGKCYFNSTSNAAMATGGMGDVLTGILAALLAQRYTPAEACIIGVYIHGQAGDELALPNQLMVVLAGSLARQIPNTMAKILA